MFFFTFWKIFKADFVADVEDSEEERRSGTGGRLR